ncbi:MAG: hypothetical protein V1806_03955 [Pseudomonadota bacterium]
MPKVPAICNRCGHVCRSRVFISDETIHIHGEEVGPCACGGTYVFLDGTYVHLGGPINLCNTSSEEIARFKEASAKLDAQS